MNVLLFDSAQLKGDILEIRELNQISHIRDILKLDIGSSLCIGEINGLLGRGIITELNSSKIKLRVQLKDKPPEKLPCSIIIALPRPQQLKRILVHLSSLGIKEIHLLQTQRVEKNYWQSPSLKEMDKYLIEGLEQAKDTLLPQLYQHHSFKHFIEKDIANVCQGKEIWLAHPGKYPATKIQEEKQHVLIVGPEGGFVPEELDRFQEHGAQIVSLGSRILKVETAIPVLLAKLFPFQ